MAGDRTQLGTDCAIGWIGVNIQAAAANAVYKQKQNEEFCVIFIFWHSCTAGGLSENKYKRVLVAALCFTVNFTLTTVNSVKLHFFLDWFKLRQKGVLKAVF